MAPPTAMCTHTPHNTTQLQHTRQSNIFFFLFFFLFFFSICGESVVGEWVDMVCSGWSVLASSRLSVRKRHTYDGTVEDTGRDDRSTQCRHTLHRTLRRRIGCGVLSLPFTRHSPTRPLSHPLKRYLFLSLPPSLPLPLSLPPSLPLPLRSFFLADCELRGFDVARRIPSEWIVCIVDGIAAVPLILHGTMCREWCMCNTLHNI